MSALRDFLRGEYRESFRSGVKSTLAVLCSHYQSIDPPALECISKGFFFPEEDDDDTMAAKTVGWYDMVEGPGNRLADSLDGAFDA